ncbi:MAG: hypothetical protein QM758_16575 [Armatimonas sp.]
MFKNLFRRDPTLRDWAQEVIALTSDEHPDLTKLWDKLQSLKRLASQARPVEKEEVLQILRTALSHSHPHVSALVAISGGGLVESGAPAALWAEALLARVPDVFSAAIRFVVEAGSRMEPVDEDSEDEEEAELGALIVAGRPVPSDIVEDLQKTDAQAVAAYRSLEIWVMPLIACLSRSTEYRNAAAADPAICTAVVQLSEHHGSMEMLYNLLEVLDHEPLLVLHPESGKGFVCRMSGIGINFELHTLLMDLLCRPDYAVPGKRLPPNLAQIAWGRAEPHANDGCVGNWNLYDWRAADLDLTDPNALDSDTWIWNEGKPADIPMFDDYRVVLLGQPSYKRMWNVGRLFCGLTPQLMVERTLPPDEVQSFLTRMASTAEQMG